jgi:hypothetical protein
MKVEQITKELTNFHSKSIFFIQIMVVSLRRQYSEFQYYRKIKYRQGLTPNPLPVFYFAIWM